MGCVRGCCLSDTHRQPGDIVLVQVKKRNQSVYQRLRALCAAAPKRFFVFANEHHRCGGCEAGG